MNLLVQIEHNAKGNRWRTLIKALVPITHLTSFGINTELRVIYDPSNKYKAILDPNYPDWHFDPEDKK